jgi:hypothetical protein
MLPRRFSNHPGSSSPLPFLVVCGLLLAAAVAFSPAAAAEAAGRGGGGGGGGAGHEGRAGKPEVEAEAEARGDGVAVAEAGGEVVAQGNATEAKEGSLADMIDRALEKEFPESESEQGGGGAWIWPTPGVHRSVRAGSGSTGGCVGEGGCECRWPCCLDLGLGGLQRVGTLRMEVPVWAWSCLC